MRRPRLIRFGFESLRLLVIAFSLVFSVLPLFWMVSTSLKTPEDYFTSPPTILPDEVTLDNYVNVAYPDPMSSITFDLWFLNSATYSSTATFASLILAFLASYAFSRFKFRGRDSLLLFMLFGWMLPGVAVAVPLYLVADAFRLLDNGLMLSFMYLLHILPMSILLLSSYFDSVPVALEEAAWLDGCSRLSALFRIVIPAVATGIVSTTIVIFTMAWNEYLFSILFVTYNPVKSLSAGLPYYVMESSIEWGKLMAASVISCLPSATLYVLLQRRFVEGMLRGGLKA